MAIVGVQKLYGCKEGLWIYSVHRLVFVFKLTVIHSSFLAFLSILHLENTEFMNIL